MPIFQHVISTQLKTEVYITESIYCPAGAGVKPHGCQGNVSCWLQLAELWIRLREGNADKQTVSTSISSAPFGHLWLFTKASPFYNQHERLLVHCLKF